MMAIMRVGSIAMASLLRLQTEQAALAPDSTERDRTEAMELTFTPAVGKNGTGPAQFRCNVAALVAEPLPSPSIESPTIRSGASLWPHALTGRDRSGWPWFRSR